MTSLHLTDAQAQDLADGLLPRDEAVPLERHAATCAACGAAVESYRMLGGALAGMEVPDLPVSFTDGVLARIDASERALARERRLAATIVAGVVAAAAAAFAVAGASAWAPAVSSVADGFAWIVTVARASAPVAGVLRMPIVVGSALLALPFLLALSRLMPRPEREIA